MTDGWDDLKTDPKNANKGTERGQKMLEESFRESGAGRSIVAAKDGTVLGGNKSKEVARKMGIKPKFVHTEGDELLVVIRDDLPTADDPKARRLAYADNRTSEVNLNWDLAQVKDDWENGVDLDPVWNKHELDVLMGDFATLDHEAEDFDDLNASLPGAAALKPGMTFPSDEPYGIPPLLPDMLGDMPQELKTWAGADASLDESYEGMWLYNYGSDSIRGLDLTRSILAFYVDDYRFENWFYTPDVYVGRMVNAGVPMAVSPNYSLWLQWPKALHIYNAYRARWLGRYMQEAGIYVIPDVTWGKDDSYDYAFAGIPELSPCVCMQAQTYSKSGGFGEQIDRDGLLAMLEVVKPESIIIYGAGKEAKLFYASLLPNSLEVLWIESRSQIRSKNVMTKGIDSRHIPEKEEVS